MLRAHPTDVLAPRQLAFLAERLPEPPRAKTGRPTYSNLELLPGILEFLRSGCRWRDLDQFGCPSGVTHWRRMRYWRRRSGYRRVWRTILNLLVQCKRLDRSLISIDGTLIPSFALRSRPVPVMHVWQRDAEPGRELLETCLPTFRELHNATWTGFTLMFLGYAAMLRNDFEQAIQLLDETLAVHQGSGWRSGQAMTLGALGVAARGRGDYARAASLSRAALALRWEHANLPGIAEELVSMADVTAGHGDPKLAVRLLGAAARLRDSYGLAGLEAYNAAHDKVVRTARKALGDEMFADAWAAGQALRLEEAIAEAMAVTGNPLVVTPSLSTDPSAPRPNRA